ncbi:MAG: signal peptidase I [Myxococcota bacterium]|nr:signal peptidase I [Myxococcota bacterium]
MKKPRNRTGTGLKAKTRHQAIAFLKDLSSILVAALIVLVARASIADHYVVPTGSMEPTVHAGDRIVVNKLAYGVRIPLTNAYLLAINQPKVGHVVVLDSPKDSKVLLKRVVAGPGDVVSLRNGVITLNNTRVPISLDRARVKEHLQGVTHEIYLDLGGGPDFGPVRLPPNKYLVVGDNRGQSLDGRSFGLIPSQAILGRAVGVYFSGNTLKWQPL